MNSFKLFMVVLLFVLVFGCTKKENNTENGNSQNGTNSDDNGTSSANSADDYIFLGYGEFSESDLNRLLSRNDDVQRSDVFENSDALINIGAISLNTASDVISRTDLTAAGITTPVPVPVDTFFKKSITPSEAAIGIRLKSISQECTHPFVPLYSDGGEISYYYLIVKKDCVDDKSIMTIEYVREEGTSQFKGKMESASYTTKALSTGNQIYSVNDTPKAFGAKKVSSGVILDLDTEISIFGYSDTKYIARNKIGLVGNSFTDEFTISGDEISSIDVIDLQGSSLPSVTYNQFNKVTISLTPEKAGKNLFSIIVNDKLSIPFNLFVAEDLQNKFNTTTAFQALNTFELGGHDYTTPLIAVSGGYFSFSYQKYYDSTIGYTAIVDTYSIGGVIQDEWESDLVPAVQSDGGYNEKITSLFFDESLNQVGFRRDEGSRKIDDTWQAEISNNLFSRNIATREITYKDVTSSDANFNATMDVYRDKIGLYDSDDNKFYIYDSTTLSETGSYSWSDCSSTAPKAISLSENSEGQLNIHFTAYQEGLDSDTYRLCIITDKLEPKFENVTERSSKYNDIVSFSDAPIIAAGASFSTLINFAIFDGLTGEGEIFEIEGEEDAQNYLNLNKLNQYIDISNDGYYTAYAFVSSETEVKIVIQAGSYVDDRKIVTLNTTSLVFDIAMKFINSDSILISLVNNDGLFSYIIE